MRERDTSTSTTTGEENVSWGRRVLTSPIRFVSFWVAVLTPSLYIPLLATGLDSPAKAAAFGVLFAVNLGTLLLGHSYRPM